MEIGYSDKTLWSNINHQWVQIDGEVRWLKHYIAIGDIECVEDCVREIESALAVIKSATEMLKSEEM